VSEWPINFTEEFTCASCGHDYSSHYGEDGLCEGDEEDQCPCRQFVNKDQLGLFAAD